MLIAIEIISVFLNLLYIYFAIKQNSIAWIFGIMAALLSVYLFIQNNYIGSAVLNIIYAILGLFGFFHWQYFIKTKMPGFKLSFIKHIFLITLLSAFFLFIIIYFSDYHFNTFIRLDILLALGSILATFLEIRKDTSCWYYWIILNTGYTIVYGIQHLYIYAALMLILGIFSYLALKQWQKSATL